jgi:hypothetical protein
MSIGLALSFVIPTATGVLLLWLVWPHATAVFPRPLAVALGAGLGAGLSGVLFFVWMLAFGPTKGFPLAEAGLLALLALAIGRRVLPARTMHAAPPEGRRYSRLHQVLIAAFLVTLAASAATFLANLRQHPHGDWDAWMDWDLRARIIFRSGDEWRTAFSAAIPWSHPDYPVLVPSLVVRNWLYAGMETLLGPQLVAATFTFGTVALLAAALAALRSPSQGLLAGLILLSTPLFIRQGASLYADVPLGFFFLATIVCLAYDGRHGPATKRFGVLAGVAAGLGMWTKNEGLLFVLAVGAGILFAEIPRGWSAVRRRLGAFGAGLLPMLILVGSFKIAFAPPNDLLSTLNIDRTMGRLTAVDRYYVTLREYKNRIGSFGNNGFGSVAWLLTAYLLGLGVSRAELGRSWARVAAVALVLLLAGYFMVYVSMSDDLSRHLNNSLDRLLLQLWPSALFLFFMVVHTPQEVGSSRPAPQHLG